MKRYKGTYMGTILKEHVGKKLIRFGNHTNRVCDFLGNIYPRDVGKQIWTIDKVWQVESDSQFKERIKNDTNTGNERY